MTLFFDGAVEVVPVRLDVMPDRVRDLPRRLSATERRRAERLVCERDRPAARFFSRRENEAFLALSPRDKPLGFFNCWTRKEAFLKALGEGLRHHLDRFEVSLAPGEPARILRVGEIPGDVCGWALRELSLGPGLVGAVVAQDFEAESVGGAGPS
jgi:hypothetical protein